MRSRRARLAVIVAVAACAGAIGWMASFGWDPAELGPLRPVPAPAPAAGQLRVVTLNAFKLSQPVRAPGVIDSLRTIGRMLGAGSERGPLPEIVALQEIESAQAIEALRRELEPTHRVTVCACAREDAGRAIRSAVLLAAARRQLRVDEPRCVPLGAVWPDHPRCAIEARLITREGRSLRLWATHLAWHLDNESMARRLRDVVEGPLSRGERVLLVGDLNTWPGSAAHRALTRGVVRDLGEGAPPTHFVGTRLDYLLAGPGVERVRGLDRRASYEALRPSSTFLLPGVCDLAGPPDCPLSDHLPEGAVLRLTGPERERRGAHDRARQRADERSRAPRR